MDAINGNGEKNDLLESALDGLAYLICTDRDEGVETMPWNRAVGARDFDGFELLEQMDTDDFILNARDAADQPVWPLDVCFATRAEEGTVCSDGEERAGYWQFCRLVTTSAKQWRGRVRIFSPMMVENRWLVAHKTGRMQAGKQPIAILGGRAVDALPEIYGGWRGHPGELNPESYAWCFRARGRDKHAETILRLGAGIALRREYMWSVLMGEGGGPRARFITDPIGVREAFRLREIPPGRERRAALKHWVRQHWRKSRRETADAALVREHLRGHSRFEWRGLQCDVEPSFEDLRRNEFLRELSRVRKRDAE